ncbi:glycoside hydrolase family 97 catalytic domain-containing protein [uncultured Paraglaciecola sp.]|uniref:glycoside hydrolase family 97 catalytic domain-containing protein n=1 Tax=uncultured Paraglaciecola sp. TaxID=1765024 RepID=UPI0026135C03|nr:glycoside hydrolase family 97 catalytic domain-containing protein [uncultured Paraglaciecola sp.]
MLKWLCLAGGLLCLSVALSAHASVQVTLGSPDSRVELQVKIIDGIAKYQLSKDKQLIIDDSAIDFTFKQQPALGSNLAVIEQVITEVNAPWQRPWGQTKQLENHYRQLVLTLKESTKLERTFQLIFRVFNDGIGFRTVLPKQPNLNRFEMTAENTEFAVVGNPTSWWIPQDFDSYEAEYRHTPYADVTAVNTPITFQSQQGTLLSIHEAALTDYAGMTLVKRGKKLVSELVPWPDGIKVRGATPFKTPWRTIQLADNAGELLISDLIENLNEPNVLTDTSWLQPMKYVGIWWGMHMREHTWTAGPKHGATTERTKAYIDFAAANDFGGVLVEGWNQGWETWHTGHNIQDYTQAYADFDLADIAKYAAQKGVTLIGHHETGGNIPMYEQQAEQAFALYAKYGVRAVKTGYAGKMTPAGSFHHGQQMVNHYRRIVELAAKYKIMLNVHEPIKATGIRRTYPNMMTREGGRGMEWNGWSEGNPPQHTLVLPFTRLLGGPMDYTPGIFDLKFDPQSQYRVHTTLARQLAHYVTLYSPMQMAADMIKNYRQQLAFEFIRQVPVDWDETHVIEADIGHHLTMARRHKQQWFLASITDATPRQIDIPLDFLAPETQYQLTLFADGPELDFVDNPTAIEISCFMVNSQTRLPAVLASGGGMAAIITPVNQPKSQCPNIESYRQQLVGRLAQFQQGNQYGKIKRVTHLAKNQSIKLIHQPDASYMAAGPNALVDGVRGGADYKQGWQGFRQQDLDAVIDLGTAQSASRIEVGFLQSILHSILLPTKIEFSVSRDGVQFTQVGQAQYHTREGEPDYQRKDFAVSFKPQNVRFIRVQATTPKTLPDWHTRPGQEAFIFADEIQLH